MANLQATTIDGGITEHQSNQSTWSGTSVTINLENGTFFQSYFGGLSGDVTTFTINGTIPADRAVSFILEMRTFYSGRDFNWAHANMKNKFLWPGGDPPTITQTYNQTDIYSFSSWDQGTTWHGSVVGQNFAPN